MRSNVAPTCSEPAGAIGRHLWIADNAVGGFHNEPAEFAAGLPVHNKDNAHRVVLNEIAEAAQNVRINRLIRSKGPRFVRRFGIAWNSASCVAGIGVRMTRAARAIVSSGNSESVPSAGTTSAANPNPRAANTRFSIAASSP